MTPQHHDMVPDQAADPFGERSAVLVRKPLHLLGARIVFDSNSRELLQLVDAAYAGLPRHRLSAKERLPSTLSTAPWRSVSSPTSG